MLRRDPLRERRGLRPPRMRGRRVTSFSLYRMIPNILTLLALCAGMTAIRFAMVGKFEAAAVAIIVAGVFDGLDGRAARLLKANTSFGAQLDSLSDFISFGVAPAVVLYAWTMSELFTLGWVIVLFYAACCALRLARFNTQLDVELPPYASNYFTGVPAAGRITHVRYRKGKFVNAALDKASEDNERMAVRMATDQGRDVAFVQIAGLIARRILCTLKEGDVVAAGQRYGLIRFGSRTDVYVPVEWPPLVIVGQRMIGGETVIADARAQEPPRQGIEH